MLRSLFSAVSGLRSHQTMMDVIGNNIANVNTTGYKSGQTVFEDTLSQAVRNAGGASQGGGGTNAAQVGLGVRVAGIATNFSQGSTQVTGRQGDMAIQGDGFFVVQKDGQAMYTRAGSFSFDSLGNLTTPEGATVQGWPAANGVINTNASTSGLKLPFGQVLAPTATGTIDIGGNLPSDAANGASVTHSIDIFDAQGRTIPASTTYTKTGTNAWTATTTVPGANGGPVTVGTTNLTWNQTTQKFNTDTMTLGRAAMATAGYTFPGDVTMSIGGDATPLTQFAGSSSATARTQDGSTMGQLQSFTMDTSGILVGVFSNGLTEKLGQVAIANFANPGGLEKAGDSMYRGSANSGQAQVGVAGTGGRGQLNSGVLEMSNVDLAQEFTNLVVAQRGFQANSRVISASDEILQDLVNLKR
ncbi:flagellar hook protein FlgE [Phycicoccus sp. Root101]|uniref:flagellar hook protein FlgE n=1 Tax=Phycicoccus sp. Root101 TaxID=1736421 RepID=UPI0007030D82|nr:flagellar hook protein FlgE [Phycicoccus sp. Root101]KQU65277.1 flagellar hook protein [Phycicoccus sp. Root101]